MNFQLTFPIDDLTRETYFIRLNGYGLPLAFQITAHTRDQRATKRHKFKCVALWSPVARRRDTYGLEHLPPPVITPELNKRIIAAVIANFAPLSLRE